jgi:hypothetical protein
MLSRPATLYALFAAAFSAAPLLAQDGVPRILIDRELNTTEVSLVRIEPDRITYRDALGMQRTEQVRRLTAITMPRESVQQSARRLPGEVQLGMIELSDGQRLMGSLHASIEKEQGADAKPDETVRWTHPLLGTVAFQLDDIHRIILQPSAVPPDAQHGTADVIILANGDRLEGFVEHIGDQLRLEVGQTARDLPLENIAAVLLANPTRAPEGTVVYLRDGSIVATDHLQPAPEGFITLIPRAAGGQPVQQGSEAGVIHLPLVEVAAVKLDAAALSPLAAMPLQRQEAQPGRRWVPPVRLLGQSPPLLGAYDLEFPGPMTAEWTLPEGAAWFAAEAELPRAMWNWGDCELIVSLVTGSGAREGTTEVFRSRMNADSPTASVRVDLLSAARQMGTRGPARLRVTIDAGMYGPIQDQIILRRPLIMLEQPPG